jgi:hypothetical protein
VQQRQEPGDAGSVRDSDGDSETETDSDSETASTAEPEAGAEIGTGGEVTRDLLDHIARTTEGMLRGLGRQAPSAPAAAGPGLPAYSAAFAVGTAARSSPCGASAAHPSITELERELAAAMREHVQFRRVHPLAAAQVAERAADTEAVAAWYRTEAMLRLLRLHREYAEAWAQMLRVQHEHAIRCLLMVTLGRILADRRRAQPGLSQERILQQQSVHMRWMMRANATDLLRVPDRRMRDVRAWVGRHRTDMSQSRLWNEITSFYAAAVPAFQARR